MKDLHPSLSRVRYSFFAFGFLLAWIVIWAVQYCRVEVPRLFSPTLQSFDFFSHGYEGFPWPVAGALGFLALFAGAVAQIGGWITGRLRVAAVAAPDDPARRFYAIEEWMLSFSAGALVVGLIVLGLGLAGVGFPWILFPALLGLSAPFWMALLFAAVMAARAAARGKILGNFPKRLPRPELDDRSRNVWAARGMFWAMVALLAFGLLYALTPPIQSDGLRYHLAAPQEYLKARRIGYLPYSAFSNFPFLIEMLFTLAMAAGTDLAAKGIHWLLLVASALWVWLLTARLAMWRMEKRDARDMRDTRDVGGGMEEPAPANRRLKTSPVWVAAAFAALLFVATPVVFIVGCWEFIDLGIAAFFFGYVYALAQWARNRRRGWLAAAGVFGAGCLGTKYTMVPLVALGGLWIAALSLATTAHDPAKPLRVAARRFVFVMAIAGTLAAPWYLKNLAMTGNPVYPMAWGIFGGGEWSAANANFYGNKALEKGFSKLIRQSPSRIPEVLARLPYATAFEWRAASYAIPDPQSAIENPQSAIRNPQSAIRNPQYIRWGGFEDHNIGPGYLLLLPLILFWAAWSAWRWRRDPARATVALFMIAYAALWFLTYQSNRFLIPLLGLACVAVADLRFTIYDLRFTIPASLQGSISSCSSIVNPPPIVNSLASTFILSVGLAVCLLNGAWAVRWIALDASHPSPLPVALGFQSRDDYLSEALPQYRFLSAMDHMVEKGAGVLFIGEHRGYYCRARYLASDWFDTPRILALIRETPDNNALFARLLAQNTRYVFFNFQELGKYAPLPADFPEPLNESQKTRYAEMLPLFYDRFTGDEWRRLTSFCASPRLKRVQTANERLFLSEIRPLQ